MEIDLIRINCGKYIEKSDFFKKCREDVFRLRYDVYCREMRVVKENSEEMLCDDYDFNSNTVIFSAGVEGRIVGTLRLVRFSERFSLPILSGHKDILPRMDKAISFWNKVYGGRFFTEASRFTLLKDFRRNRGSDGRLISIMLMLDYIEYCKDFGLTDIVGISNPNLLPFYQKIGFKPLFFIKDELTGIESPIVHGEVNSVGQGIRRLKIKITFLKMINRFRRFLVEWVRGDYISRAK